MTKHKKKIGVILIVILMSLIWFTPTIGVKAIVNGDAAKKPDKCDSAHVNELRAYYNIKYDWDEDGKTITFTSSKGEFRFTHIDTKFFTNSFNVDSDGFYEIDGHKGVFSKDKKVKLIIKNSARGESATVNIALSKDTSPCDSLTTYKTKKAKNPPETTATFETGKFEIVIPFSSDGSTDKVKDDNSSNYNGVCKALRNGENYHNKISATAMAEYVNSANAKSYYSIIAPSCFDESKKALYVFDEASMIKVIESALTTFKTYDQLKNNSVLGGGDTDVTGEKFMLDFADIKNKAIASGHQYYAVQDKAGEEGAIKDNGSKFYKNDKNGSLVKDLNEAVGMKCRVTANSVNDFSNLEEHKDGKYNINANAKYYYGYDESSQSITYKWFTSKKETKDPFCSKKCEEVVEVNYGPPVASKAGSCFEYQVQVTSRVKCTTHLDGNPPEYQPYCVPVPYCNDIPGHIHQAGANEQYMECIQSCDGGKYTSACSEQCYKEIYQNKKTTKNEKTVKSKKTYSTTYSYSGHHYFSGNKIFWSGSGYASYYYYFERGRTASDHGRYVPESGFKKRLYDNGKTCTDPCFFSGCKNNNTVYINKAKFIEDYKTNLDAYTTAINACKASASCTTKTATFTIKTHYKNRKGTKITISYPLDTSDLAADTPELLDSDADSTKCHNDTKVKADNNIILGFGNYVGCYKHCGNGLQYHTRWSYPGTWLDEKHGGHSFKPQTGNDWEKQENKFCLTMDAQDVNSKWWKYYYGLYDKKNTTSLDNEAVKAYCLTLDPQGADEITSEDDIEDWNINASTRKFGYYGWNFDISCFYALNSKNTQTTPPSTTVKTDYCNTGGDKITYRIRTVDLKNLFPASETNASGSATRAPGFNWSKNASVLASNDKNPEYQSMPSVYAEQVQSLGYNVYSEDNLEYQFELTKAILKDLKNGDRNYGNFTGDMVTQHGVHSYQSDAIRSGVFSSAGKHVLDEQAIGCNNVANYSSTSCTDIKEKEE